MNTLNKKRMTHYLIPLVIYIPIWGIAEYWGNTMLIPWRYYQLMDYYQLLHYPINTLYLLHAQPPLLNTLLAIILQISTFSGVAPELIAKSCFIVLGIGSTFLLYSLLAKFTQSIGLSILGVIVLLLNPGYHFFQNFYFYPFLVHAFLILFLWACAKYLNQREHYSIFLLGAVGLLALICNTRTLFHPVWAIVSFILLIVFKFRIYPNQPRRYKELGGLAIILGILVFAWPLKNYFLFDQFTFSSWIGRNLTRGTGITHPMLDNYLRFGAIPKRITSELTLFQQQNGLTNIDVIANPKKFENRPNWNHYLFLEVNRELAYRGIAWRFHHPLTWIKMIVRQYFLWSRATYIHPYYLKIRGPSHPQYQNYANFHHAICYFDLSPFLHSYLPLWLHGVPMTIFGIIVFPTMMLMSLYVALSQLRSKPSVEAAIMLLVWFTVFWTLIVPCFTDGTEGNRMRFSTSGLFMLLVLLTPCMGCKNYTQNRHCRK